LPDSDETPTRPSGRGPAEVALAILFADLGGSTRLYDELGNVEARRIVTGWLERITQLVGQLGGRVVKTIGDEVMATFPTAEQASVAAREIQLCNADESGDDDQPRVDVQVGLHYGLALPEEDDVFGDAVNVAARMVGLARPGEILTTAQTVARLSDEERTRTRQIDRRLLKGKQQEFDVFEVVWQTRELTALHSLPTRGEPVPEHRLVLRFGDAMLELSPDRPEIRIGRATDNDLVMTDPSASRQHARLELRQGKFVLYDRSTNGTVVHPRGGAPILLRREELILPPAGTIHIGGAETEGPDEGPIRFHSEPWLPDRPR
jgi:class 3 adenylate cyclase